MKHKGEFCESGLLIGIALFYSRKDTSNINDGTDSRKQIASGLFSVLMLIFAVLEGLRVTLKSPWGNTYSDFKNDPKGDSNVKK